MTCPHCREEIETMQERLRQFEAIFAADDLPSEADGLSGHERRLFGLLYKRMPRPVPKEQLMAALYFDRDDDRGPKIVDVFVCKIRKKLIGKGLHIATHWGVGFALCEGEDPAANRHAFPRGRTPKWTPEEDEVIRQSASPREASSRLNRRTPNAVWARAQKIGHRWSKRARQRLAA